MFGFDRQSSISERMEDLYSNGDSIWHHDGRCQESDVREFRYCYHPDEIDKFRGMYSLVLSSPLLKVIYETSDSNRD